MVTRDPLNTDKRIALPPSVTLMKVVDFFETHMLTYRTKICRVRVGTQRNGGDDGTGSRFSRKRELGRDKKDWRWRRDWLETVSNDRTLGIRVAEFELYFPNVRSFHSMYMC
jgi:hypothetical protein